MKKIVLFFLLLSVQLVNAENSGMIGTQSQEMVFNTMLNFKKSSAKLSDFKSKVVILDFWATWCSNCIEGFPHLENLQNKYKNDLQVLTVTDETNERIKRYLSLHPMSLPVVIDTSKTINGLFPHKMIPHTIVIDKSGVIRAITTPENITGKVIEELIAGNPIALSEKVDLPKKDPLDVYSIFSDVNVRFLTFVEPEREDLTNVTVTVPNGNRFLATNRTICALFESAYNYPGLSRTVIQVRDVENVRSNKYCFLLVVPEEDGSKCMQIMQQQLEQVFPYKAQVVEKRMPVKLLKVVEDAKLKLTAKTDTGLLINMYRIDGEGLWMKKCGINGLTKFAESRLKIPVIDETGLTGQYDLILNSYEDEASNLNQELRKLGLELVDAERTIKMLVITDR